MKVSEITVDDVVLFARIDDYDEFEIENILNAAKAYVRSYTGLSDAQIDENEDLYTAVMVLCQDMHDNRSMYVDVKNGSAGVNRVVDTILGMHCVNLL